VSCSQHSRSISLPLNPMECGRFGLMLCRKAFWPVTCCGLHYLSGRLAIEHPSWPTIIDSGGCSQPTLSAPEPRLLILGSQSAPAGPHYVHRAVASRMTALVRADGRLPTPRTTGGINTLIRRVLPDFPRSPPRYRGVIARKTRRITRGVPATGSLQIMWAPVQSMWAGGLA
jgi:hypothetical protein